MKRKLLLLSGIMLCIAMIGAIIISLFSNKTGQEHNIETSSLKVVATFYPVYLIGENLAGTSEGIKVDSLTDLNTGCLHDYQLTTEDMKLISEADILIINGGGIEAFVEDVRANYPELTIIDASTGITMLEEENVSVDTSAEARSGSGTNPHVWLDPELYIRQIENVRDGLVRYIESSSYHSALSSSVLNNEITQNAEVYIREIKKLDQKYLVDTAASQGQSANLPKAVIFHDSFAYLARKAGIEVAFTVPLDSDTSLSAGDIASIIDAVKKEDIKYLFTEEQYSDSIAKQIEAETDAKVYIIDSVVTGNGDKDSYLNAMDKNLKVIKDALSR